MKKKITSIIGYSDYIQIMVDNNIEILYYHEDGELRYINNDNNLSIIEMPFNIWNKIDNVDDIEDIDDDVIKELEKYINENVII